MEEISTLVGTNSSPLTCHSASSFPVVLPKPGIVSSQDSKYCGTLCKTPELSLRSAHSCLLAWCVLKF